jgi:hypothetical protein
LAGVQMSGRASIQKGEEMRRIRDQRIRNEKIRR